MVVRLVPFFPVGLEVLVVGDVGGDVGDLGGNLEVNLCHIVSFVA